MIISSVCKQPPTFYLSSDVLNSIGFWLLYKCSPVVLVNVVVLLLSLSARPDINEVRKCIIATLIFFLVVHSFKSIKSTLSCILRFVTCQTNTVQVKFVLDLWQRLLKLLSSFQRVIKNLFNACISYFIISCRDYFLGPVFNHTQDFSVWQVRLHLLLLFAPIVTLLHD